MCKTVLYSFTVILGSARNIEMLNDACMLFPVAISKKCRKSLRYSIGFSCFSDAPVAVVLSRSVARSKSEIGRRSSWISRMQPSTPYFRFKCWYLELGSRFSIGGQDRSYSPLFSAWPLFNTFCFHKTPQRRSISTWSKILQVLLETGLFGLCWVLSWYAFSLPPLVLMRLQKDRIW